MTQPSLLDHPVPRFDSGVDLTSADHVRLGAQLKRVLAVLSDGAFWSVPELHNEIWRVYGIHDPETSLASQIRNLKKSKFEGHQIERVRLRNVFKFRLVA